jgi:hypothetical protein
MDYQVCRFVSGNDAPVMFAQIAIDNCKQYPIENSGITF